MAANIDLESLKTELDEYGFVTIPNVISSLDADLMAKRVVDIMSRQPDSGELDNHLPSLLEHVMDTDESDLFFSAVTIPVYLELARHAVGEGFQSAGEAMRWTKPGWAGQPLHADGPAGIFARSGHPAPGQWPVINSLLMLSKFSRENGGTLLMPFSHHSRLLPRKGVKYSHLVAAEGDPGTIVIFIGSIWHAGGANTTTDQHRLGLSIAYHAAWLEHGTGGGHWPSMKRSVRDRLPQRIQEMNRRVVED